MPKIREFKTYSEKEQVSILLRCLTNAIMEHSEISNTRYHRTDLIGIACQYKKCVRREDFDLIKDMKIEDIVNMFMKEWK